MLEKQFRSLKLCGYCHTVQENASVDLKHGLWILTENRRAHFLCALFFSCYIYYFLYINITFSKGETAMQLVNRLDQTDLLPMLKERQSC